MGEAELAAVFRRIRDEIGGFCRALVANEIPGARTNAANPGASSG